MKNLRKYLKKIIDFCFKNKYDYIPLGGTELYKNSSSERQSFTIICGDTLFYEIEGAAKEYFNYNICKYERNYKSKI